MEYRRKLRANRTTKPDITRDNKTHRRLRHATLCNALSPKSAGKLEILRLDRDTLGVDGSEVGVLKERHEVSLGGLLESHDGR